MVVTQVDQCDRYDRKRAGSFSLFNYIFFFFFQDTMLSFFPVRGKLTSARTTFELSAPLKRQSGRKGEAITLKTSVENILAGGILRERRESEELSRETT